MAYQSTSYYLHRFDEPSRIHEMTKFDSDLGPVAVYTIRQPQPGEYVCSCPAHISNCRHVQMLKIFERAERGEDPLYYATSDNGKYVTFLKWTAQRTFDWVRGMEKPDE